MDSYIQKGGFVNCIIQELFIYVMYWRFPPRSGLFLRRSYLFSSIFEAGYTTMFQVSSQEKTHMGIFHVMSTSLIAHHEGRTEFWTWFWYVGTHLRRQTSNRTVLVQMFFGPLRCHLQSPSTILIRKDNDPRIVASSVMQICYKSTRETERQALDFAQILLYF